MRTLKNSYLKNLLKPISCILYGLLIVILLWHYSQSRTTSLYYIDHQGTTHTLTLPVKDKKRLTGLMQKLFAENNFAYTTLGFKPVSWALLHNGLHSIESITFAKMLTPCHLISLKPFPIPIQTWAFLIYSSCLSPYTYR